MDLPPDEEPVGGDVPQQRREPSGLKVTLALGYKLSTFEKVRNTRGFFIDENFLLISQRRRVPSSPLEAYTWGLQGDGTMDITADNGVKTLACSMIKSARE
jgi:hypothetical protein